MEATIRTKGHKVQHLKGSMHIEASDNITSIRFLTDKNNRQIELKLSDTELKLLKRYFYAIEVRELNAGKLPKA